MIGGKLARFRLFAQELCDLVAPRHFDVHVPCSTHERPLPGGERVPMHGQLARLSSGELARSSSGELALLSSGELARSSSGELTLDALKVGDEYGVTPVCARRLLYP